MMTMPPWYDVCMTDREIEDSYAHTYIWICIVPGNWYSSFMLCAATCHHRRVKPSIDLKGCHIYLFSRHWLTAVLADFGSMPTTKAYTQHTIYKLICFSCVDFKYPDKPAKLQEDHINIFTAQTLLSLAVTLLLVCERSVVKQSPESCCTIALQMSAPVLSVREPQNLRVFTLFSLTCLPFARAPILNGIYYIFLFKTSLLNYSWTQVLFLRHCILEKQLFLWQMQGWHSSPVVKCFQLSH